MLTNILALIYANSYVIIIRIVAKSIHLWGLIHKIDKYVSWTLKFYN